MQLEKQQMLPWMSLSEVLKHVPEAQQLGVSKVARGKDGFLTAYKRAGTSHNMTRHWHGKRHAFIRRHLAQYKRKPTQRRKLALIIWAYNPDLG